MSKFSQAGVTLLEAMVVVIIVGILVAIATPSYQSTMAELQVRTKAESLLNGLQMARSESLRRNTRIFFTFGTDSNWTMGCDTTVADTNGDGQADCPASIQTKAAEEGGTTVTIAAIPTASRTATFTGLGLLAATNKDGTAPFTQINFSNSKTTKTYRVTLSSGGQSKLCDPSVTATGDAKLC